MKKFAVLPIKRLDIAKTRLSPILSNDGRRRLVLRLFLRTGLLCQKAGLKVVCMTSDQTVLKIAASKGWLVSEDKTNDLNTALTHTLKSLQKYPSVIVLPDLPLLQIDSLKNILRLGQVYGCVICPDLKADGTNILYVADSGCLKPSFGSCSFSRHFNRLSRLYPVKVFVELGTALDIDRPDDLLLFSTLSPRPFI